MPFAQPPPQPHNIRASEQNLSRRVNAAVATYAAQQVEDKRTEARARQTGVHPLYREPPPDGDDIPPAADGGRLGSDYRPSRASTLRLDPGGSRQGRGVAPRDDIRAARTCTLAFAGPLIALCTATHGTTAGSRTVRCPATVPEGRRRRAELPWRPPSGVLGPESSPARANWRSRALALVGAHVGQDHVRYQLGYLASAVPQGQ